MPGAGESEFDMIIILFMSEYLTFFFLETEQLILINFHFTIFQSLHG